MCSKTLAWYRSPQWQCRLECIQCGASDHTFSEGIPGNNCLGEEGTFKIVSPALVCCECVQVMTGHQTTNRFAYITAVRIHIVSGKGKPV